jgi:putative transposase
VKAYEFVEREKATYPVVRLCRVLGVSPSGYWAWRKRAPSARARADAELTAHSTAIHRASQATYGTPRVHAELAAAGTRCGRKRVARLMRHAGLVGCHRRRFVKTTQREPGVGPAPDLVCRAFTADAPDRLWVADITYVPTWEGILYLAVVGWSMAAHLRAELVVDALAMAVWNRRPSTGVIHHSDHGCQYTSLAFSARC